MSDKRISVGILGFGGRGLAMANAVGKFPDKIYVKAIAEPAENRRRRAIEEYNVPEENVFSDYRDFLEKGVIADLLMITTMDTMHYEPLIKALELGYKNIVLEKPIAPNLDECLEMTRLAKEKNANVVVLHSLRYSNYFRKLHEIVASGKLGEVMGVRHIEGASFMNYTHAFVRGNFANTDRSAPFIMQKSCHDTDILSFITGLKYKKVFCFGDLSYFNEAHAPEGCADRCCDCKYKDECRFSGYLLYPSPYHKPWFGSAVTLHGYSSVDEAMKKGDYGRCVFKCDNNVMDNEAITFEFENGAKGTFTLTAFDSGRRTEIEGTHRVMVGKESTGIIEIYDQIAGNPPEIIDVNSSSSATLDHHVTDTQLISELITFINEGDPTGLSFIEGALHSHLACFAAEISRKEERVVYIDELLK